MQTRLWNTHKCCISLNNRYLKNINSCLMMMITKLLFNYLFFILSLTPQICSAKYDNDCLPTEGCMGSYASPCVRRNSACIRNNKGRCSWKNSKYLRLCWASISSSPDRPIHPSKTLFLEPIHTTGKLYQICKKKGHIKKHCIAKETPTHDKSVIQ